MRLPETGPTHSERPVPQYAAEKTRRPLQNDGAGIFICRLPKPDASILFAVSRNDGTSIGPTVLHTRSDSRDRTERTGADRSFPAKTGRPFGPVPSPPRQSSKPSSGKRGRGPSSGHRSMPSRNGQQTKEVPRRSEAPLFVGAEPVGRSNAPKNRRGSSAGMSRPDAARTKGNRRGWAHRGSSGLRARWPNGSRATFRPAAGGTCP